MAVWLFAGARKFDIAKKRYVIGRLRRPIFAFKRILEYKEKSFFEKGKKCSTFSFSESRFFSELYADTS
jgi:hypothetical protein